MDVRIETIEPIRVVYFRGYGPYQKSLPPLWKRMNEYAGRRNLHSADAWYLTVPHDDPGQTPPEQIRGDACISVPADFVPDGDAAVQTIPGGPFAIYRYVGPYDGLANAWGQLINKWMPTSGHHPREAPCFEVYRNDPGSTAPAELVTELYQPVDRDA